MWLVLKATFAPTTAKRLLACEERFLDLTGVKAAAQLGNTVLLSFFQDPLSFCFVYKIQSSPLPVLEKNRKFCMKKHAFLLFPNVFSDEMMRVDAAFCCILLL